jgi:hypothetical protein
MRRHVAHAAVLLGLPASLLCNACQPRPIAADTALAMEDSARAHDERIRKSLESGDSAAYMAAYPEGVVMLFEGRMSKDRDRLAKRVGENFASSKMKKVTFSDEQIRTVGPRAAAVSLKFQMTGVDPGNDREGVWSGVLGIQDGRTVILQQHLSDVPPATSISLAEVVGKWKMRSTDEAGGNPVEVQLIATPDSNWTFIGPNRAPLPERVVVVAGDSIVTEAGPYESFIRKGVQVRTRDVLRLEGGKLISRFEARYALKGGDSVAQRRSEGTRIR